MRVEDNHVHCVNCQQKLAITRTFQCFGKMILLKSKKFVISRAYHQDFGSVFSPAQSWSWMGFQDYTGRRNSHPERSGSLSQVCVINCLPFVISRTWNIFPFTQCYFKMGPFPASPYPTTSYHTQMTVSCCSLKLSNECTRTQPLCSVNCATTTAPKRLDLYITILPLFFTMTPRLLKQNYALI